MTPENIRSFRSRVAILKRKGLLSDVDARSVKPTTKIKGKKASTWVDRFDDVLSNKVAAVKVPKRALRAYRSSSGYQTASGRLLVPHSLAETVKFRGGKIVITHKAGLERVQIPVEYHKLEEYLDTIARRKKSINKLHGEKEYFAFRFFGNNSMDVYSDIATAIKRVKTYEAVMQARTRKQQKEVYQHLEFVKISKPSEWFREGKETREARKRDHKRGHNEKMRRYRNNLKTSRPEKYKAMLQKQKRTSKQWRKNKKLNTRK
jgi:hypothetical protein